MKLPGPELLDADLLEWTAGLVDTLGFVTRVPGANEIDKVYLAHLRARLARPTADAVVGRVGDALAATRPRMLAAPLDCLFQHKQDAEAIADAIGLELKDFDRAKFLTCVGWKRELTVDQGTTHDDDTSSTPPKRSR